MNHRSTSASPDCSSAVTHAASAANRGGFTLIQLLLVIAIIGILMAMLLAALGTAKRKGKTATCINNLRECYLAHMAYVGDYEDFLPPNRYVYGPLGSPWPESWDQVLGVHNKYVSVPDVMKCPSLEPESYEPGRVYGSFIRNLNAYGELDNIPQQLDTDPSNVILLVDSLRVSDMKQVWFYAHHSFGCWQRVHLRHNKFANTLFLDGHVANQNRGDFVSMRVKPVVEHNYGHWYLWPQH